MESRRNRANCSRLLTGSLGNPLRGSASGPNILLHLGRDYHQRLRLTLPFSLSDIEQSATISARLSVIGPVRIPKFSVFSTKISRPEPSTICLFLLAPGCEGSGVWSLVGFSLPLNPCSHLRSRVEPCGRKSIPDNSRVQPNSEFVLGKNTCLMTLTPP